MKKKSLAIHSENILPIIKKWLYSEKDIFLRELISNAVDAISKLKVLSKEIPEEEFRIDIKIDKDNKTLTISDTGLGMSAEEVEKYIAQIAFSGAEEFMQKYESKQEMIGHFGLGFYSGYMVADKVEIQTLSYKEKSKPVFWSCSGSSEYEIGKGNREKRGTDIILHINEENLEYLEEPKLKELLLKFSAYLPYPIYLGETRINKDEPLWIKNPSDCTDQEYKEFYRSLYPTEPEPIFWIHLNVDYPFNLKGILYFPRIQKRFDPSESTIKLFCSRVFVSSDCKDILPEYLMSLKGAIDSPDIPLNVSRSYLQTDKTVRQLGSHISKKIADRLSQLHKTDEKKFNECWGDLEMIIKLGLLQDEKFYDRIKSILVWKNLSDEWTTVEDYIERNKEKTSNKVFYTIDESSPQLNLYKSKGNEVLICNAHIDNAVMSFLESKLPETKFQRIDGALDESILDKDREKSVLDSDGKTEASKIAEFIRSNIEQEGLEVEAKSLNSDSLPALLVIDEDSRRLRDYMAMTQGGAAVQLPTKQTLVVNTNSKLIQSAKSLSTKNPDLAKEIVTQVYDLARLSQRELEPKQIADVIAKNTEVMEKLTELATQ